MNNAEPSFCSPRPAFSWIPFTTHVLTGGLLRNFHLRVTALLSLLLFISLSDQSHASSEAMIIIGLSGDETDAQHLSELSSRTVTLLGQRGFSADHITVVQSTNGEKIHRDQILEAIKKRAQGLRATDEFWLILYGHNGRSNDSEPVLQLAGPRLKASDLAQILKKLPAHQFVFIGTENSGAFLPYLSSPHCTALSATAENGEANAPRFPDTWIDALSEHPRASFEVLAARASEKVEQIYANLGLAVGEHARLADPKSGRILEAPFGITNLAQEMKKEVASPSGSSDPGVSQDTDLPNGCSPQPKFNAQPPTAENKKLLSQAKATPNPDDFAALMLNQEISFTVNSDRTSLLRTKQQIYLVRDEAAENWGNVSFRTMPPFKVSRIVSARTILPDGSSLVFDANNYLPQAPQPTDGVQNYQFIAMPHALGGCILEICSETSELPEGGQPEFYQEIPVQQSIPLLQNSITLKCPLQQEFHYRLNATNLPPQESKTEFSKVYTWTLKDLPAWEPLPLDLPARTSTVWLGVSSLKTWDDFASWYHRIAKDSDAIDATITKEAAELAQSKQTTREKIKAAFEFVSGIRYVAIECGIHGFRPRNPSSVMSNRFGDCKDKANLLVALLHEMKLPASFVLLNRFSSSDPDFPGWQFNHAIAYVPASPEKGIPDPLWLDSTDTTTPFGSVPPGDLGCQALVFEGDHPHFKVVSLPTGSKSTIKTVWTGTQSPTGGWQGQFEITYTGLTDEELRRTLINLSPLQRAFTLGQSLNICVPNAEFTGFKFPNLHDLATPVHLSGVWSLNTPVTIAASLPFHEALVLPVRRATLRLNYGQPLEYEQTIKLLFANPLAKSQPPKNFSADAAGAHFAIQENWNDNKTFTRTATCQITEATILVDQYPTFRTAFRTWQANLSQPINP